MAVNGPAVMGYGLLEKMWYPNIWAQRLAFVQQPTGAGGLSVKKW